MDKEELCKLLKENFEIKQVNYFYNDITFEFYFDGTKIAETTLDMPYKEYDGA